MPEVKEITKEKKAEYNKTYYDKVKHKSKKWCDVCEKYLHVYGWSKHIKTNTHLNKGGG